MNSFFAFWIKNRRMTMLLVVLLIAAGGYSLMMIPKESSPTISFGIANVTTVYRGASPEDVDDLISEEIEKQLIDVDGVDSIESTSSLGLSVVSVTLETQADTTETITKIRDEVDKVDLPSEAEDPVVTEIETDTDRALSVIMYASADQYDQSYLYDQAAILEQHLESELFIGNAQASVDINYDIQVVVNKAQADSLGLDTRTIAQTISSSTSTTPLGNFQVGQTFYDYTIDRLITNERDINTLTIPTAAGSVQLSDIAIIQRDYARDSYSSLITEGSSGYHYVKIDISKASGESILSVAGDIKASVEERFLSQSDPGLQFQYAEDTADNIYDSFADVGSNGLITIVLVFIAVFIFVGLKQSIIATISIPLAFFVTFIVLNQLDLSLNFLTNFSLIVTFGIAIDTIIVIIEAATEKSKLGYNPLNAALLAVDEFKRPLIAGTTTTCVVFIPLFVLPGVTGKFLAYIPITIFITLIAGLMISLIINPVFYYLFTRKESTYEENKVEEEVMDELPRQLLAEDRQGKTLSTHKDDRRHRFFGGLGRWYVSLINPILGSKRNKLLMFFIPIILLIISFATLASRIGFTFFPSGDNPFITLSIESSAGTTRDVFTPYYDRADAVLADIPEIKLAYYDVTRDTWTINVELYKLEDRDEYGGRSAFVVEEELLERLGFVTEQGWKITSSVAAGGPPAGSAVGVTLIANSTQDFDTLTAVARDIEEHLRTIEGTRNVNNSAQTTPGQFSFSYNQAALQQLGLTAGQVSSGLFGAIFGVDAGAIPGAQDDIDIRVVYDEYIDGITPSAIEQVSIALPNGQQVAARDVMTYSLQESVDSFRREDGNIVVNVDADVTQDVAASIPQAALIDFVESYDFPPNITYSAGGETNENADIIQATTTGAIISLMVIYTILVLQFNSLRQPVFIIYSIFVALLGSNIGLRLTGNPYSMSFGIGFIALMGIVVNDAIVLMDRINYNRARGMTKHNAIVEAGQSRLQPILLTTITTIVGLMSVAGQDEFFAGLAYTIMFGLFVGSLMTLFALPAMYSLWSREEKSFN